jgi:hypothetical protein
MGVDRWALADGRWPMGVGRWALTDGRWPMGVDRCTNFKL